MPVSTATISYGGTTFTFPNLTEAPLSLEVSDASRGRVAESLRVVSLLKPSQAGTLRTLCMAWNAAKLPEEDAVKTGTLGATVSVTATVPGWFTWSARPCWIIDGPSSTAAGSYLRTSIGLVDAAAQLAIRLREIEEGPEQEEALGLGTITLGGAVINLTAYAETLGDLPQGNLSPTGAHVLSGPLVVEEVREIRGWVTAAHLTSLRSWVMTSVASTPTVGAWWPRSWSTPEAFLRTNAGVVAVAYRVQLTVFKVRG